MRDAFGGAFMIRLFLVFIIIYVGFIALALNYAKAFKVKNEVIEYLEENEIATIVGMISSDESQMDSFISNEVVSGMNYYVEGVDCNKPTNAENIKTAYCKYGIKIEEYSPYPAESANPETNKDGVYYRVSTYFGWSIPFINALRSLRGRDSETVFGLWKISGETRTIVGS